MSDGYIDKRILKQEIALGINDYETKERVQEIIDRIKEVDLLDRDKGKEPKLETHTSVSHVSYADGSGGFESNTFTKCRRKAPCFSYGDIRRRLLTSL